MYPIPTEPPSPGDGQDLDELPDLEQQHNPAHDKAQ